MPIDIISTAPWPVCELSNFAPHKFVFDGIHCGSMEGLLQAFKFPEIHNQVRLCGLEGIVAKVSGRAGNSWVTKQTLYWKSCLFARDSEDYQLLLNQAFSSLYRDSADFRYALSQVGNGMLTHSIGEDDPTKTVLTAKEFCSRLEFLRDTKPNVRRQMWITIECERALYVDHGRDVIACDRFPTEPLIILKLSNASVEKVKADIAEFERITKFQ